MLHEFQWATLIKKWKNLSALTVCLIYTVSPTGKMKAHNCYRVHDSCPEPNSQYMTAITVCLIHATGLTVKLKAHECYHGLSDLCRKPDSQNEKRKKHDLLQSVIHMNPTVKMKAHDCYMLWTWQSKWKCMTVTTACLIHVMNVSVKTETHDHYHGLSDPCHGFDG